MGAVAYNNEKKNYYNVNGFNFTQRAQVGQSGATMRTITKKSGETREVWEFLFTELSGNITSIETKDTDFGKQYEITLEDLGEVMCLQVNADSGYADSLISRLPNIDVSQSVTLTAYSFTPDGQKRKKEGINVVQNGVKLQSAFTKEKPNGMPTVEKLQAADIMSNPPQSDDWKVFFVQVRKFLAKVASDFNDKLKGLKPQSAKERVMAENAKENINFEEDSSDLPF